MIKVKTDNDRLLNKIDLRIELLNKIDKDTINILELYGGNNILYNYIKPKTEKKLNIVSIEKKYKIGNNIYGDKEKYLPRLDLSIYDIIDADAYGNPFHLIEIIKKNKTFKGCWILYTFIRAGVASLTHKMLIFQGIKKEWIKKCHSIFEKKREFFYENYLALNNVNKIYEREYQDQKYKTNKKYGYFYLKPI